MNRDMDRYLDDRPEAEIFRIHRDAFSDPELLELEIKYIFIPTRLDINCV